MLEPLSNKLKAYNLNKVQPECLQLYEKETPTQGFSYEYCEILTNTYFKVYLRTYNIDYNVGC